MIPRCTDTRCAGTCLPQTCRYASTAPNSLTTITTPTTRSFRYKRAQTANYCECPGRQPRVQTVLNYLFLMARVRDFLHLKLSKYAVKIIVMAYRILNISVSLREYVYTCRATNSGCRCLVVVPSCIV